MKYFRTICADPPWVFQDKLPGPGRGAQKHYSVMSQLEIELFLPRLVSPLGSQPPSGIGLTEDAWLFLWRVASQVPEAYRVAEAWGFRATAEIVWVKTKACKRCKGTGVLAQQKVAFEETPKWKVPCGDCGGSGESKDLRIGMGRTVRNAHEACIVAKRGRPTRLSASVPSVLFAPRGEHSAKPEAFRDLVERLAPGPYLELFARTRRKGWTCMGDELGGEP